MFCPLLVSQIAQKQFQRICKAMKNIFSCIKTWHIVATILLRVALYLAIREGKSLSKSYHAIHYLALTFKCKLYILLFIILKLSEWHNLTINIVLIRSRNSAHYSTRLLIPGNVCWYLRSTRSELGNNKNTG